MSVTAAIGRIQDIQDRILSIVDPASARAATTQASTQTTDSATATPQASTATADTFSEILKAIQDTPAVTTVADTAPTGESTGKVTNPGQATGEGVAAAAQKYIGVPYVWGGNDESGMDCSGFVKKVFGDLGIEMPRLARDQMFKGELVDGFENAQPGDLISSFAGEHISIYLGNGKAIDAPVPGQTIQIRDAWEMSQNLEKIVRVIPSGDSAGPATPAVSADISAAQSDFLAALSS